MDRIMLNNLVYLLLKIGAVIYLAPIAIGIINSLNPVDSGENTARVIVIISYAVLGLFLLVLPKESFNLFGFIIIFIAACYQLVNLVFQKGYEYFSASHFFIILISIYFMTKVQRKKRHSVHTF